MWSPEKRINELPLNIAEIYMREADFFYWDLYNNRLVVRLRPAPYPYEGHNLIRVVESQNPKWYRDLFWSNKNFRRDLSLASLDRLRTGRDKEFDGWRYKYDELYRFFIHSRLIEGLEIDGGFLEPNNLVRKYFGLEELENYSDIPF